jgi:hypothetical protein
MKRLISGHNLTSVVSQSGGYLSSGYKLNKNVVNLRLKKSKYMKGFGKKNKSLRGGSLRSGSEVRVYNDGQKGGSVRGGSEVRVYNDGQKGGSVRGGIEVRTYNSNQTTKQSGGTRRQHKKSNRRKRRHTKIKKRKGSRK